MLRDILPKENVYISSSHGFEEIKVITMIIDSSRV